MGLTRKKGINKRSKKRQMRDKAYPARRREVLDRDGTCQYPDCWVPAVSTRCDVHHIESRAGDAMENLVSLCNDFEQRHHTWVHANRRMGEELGLRRSSVRVNHGDS